MTESIIDLRSDTVTQPCQGMKAAMISANIGDDVYGEDPTVAVLQEKLAEMTGKEAGLFFPSGTQSNLVALLSHCQRGDEYIVGQNAHTYKYEGGGAAVLGSIQPQPIEHEADGTLNLDRVAKAIKEDDFHFARTRLLALENTIGGKIVGLEYIGKAKQLTRDYNMGFHLDGARVFNAAVGLNVPMSTITQHFDSVSICLSKGLGAPIGSVLCGSHKIISNAQRWRKMVGGGMRQVGILAAAGIFALDNNIARLKEDHELAAYLGEKLGEMEEIELVGGKANTNILFFTLRDKNYAELAEYAEARGLRFSNSQPIRMVTHRHITKEQVLRTVEILKDFFA
ncbi:MAG: low-specificity L-threonine aldolase [Gammaproteobacteria bacterium]|nr:low-specificity L-threonine aldolase [Gammaproteobacteria bacterium]